LPISEAFSLESAAANIGANDGASGANFTTVQGFITWLFSPAGASALASAMIAANALPGILEA
jgi:hypothetical protein